MALTTATTLYHTLLYLLFNIINVSPHSVGDGWDLSCNVLVVTNECFELNCLNRKVEVWVPSVLSKLPNILRPIWTQADLPDLRPT